MGVIGVSACGAICHNIGQIAVASLILGVGAVWAYFPVLVISGLIMGPVTGLVAKSVFSALKKSGTEFYINPRTFRESRWADIVIIACMLAVSGAVWWGMSSNGLDFKNVGSSQYYLEVVQNSEVIYEIPMTDYGSYTIKNSATGGENHALDAGLVEALGRTTLSLMHGAPTWSRPAVRTRYASTRA